MSTSKIKFRYPNVSSASEGIRKAPKISICPDFIEFKPTEGDTPEEITQECTYSENFPSIPHPPPELIRALNELQSLHISALKKQKRLRKRKPTLSNFGKVSKINGFTAFKSYYSKNTSAVGQGVLSSVLSKVWTRYKHQDVWDTYAELYRRYQRKEPFYTWLQRATFRETIPQGEEIFQPKILYQDMVKFGFDSSTPNSMIKDSVNLPIFAETCELPYSMHNDTPTFASNVLTSDPNVDADELSFYLSELSEPYEAYSLQSSLSNSPDDTTVEMSPKYDSSLSAPLASTPAFKSPIVEPFINTNTELDEKSLMETFFSILPDASFAAQCYKQAYCDLSNLGAVDQLSKSTIFNPDFADMEMIGLTSNHYEFNLELGVNYIN